MATKTVPFELLEALLARRCVLFVGAGVSASSGLPTASDLSEHLANEAGYPESFPADLIEISQYFQEKFGRARLLDSLGRLLHSSATPSSAHHAIAALPFQLIVTTNYDQLIEQAFETAKRPLYTVRSPSDLGGVAHLQPSSATLLKIHGDIATGSVVLTRDDYFNFVAEAFSSPIGAYLRACLVTGSVLFVGYSLRDYNFALLFDSVQRQLGEYLPRSFAAMPRPDAVTVKVWQRKGVSILDLDANQLFESLAESMKRPSQPTVFISYSLGGAVIANHLAEALQGDGISSFLAGRDLHWGDDWAARIREAIVRSDAVVPIITHGSSLSDWAQEEIRLALALHPGKVFPVRVDDAELPESIRTIQFMDASSEEESAISRMRIGLRDRLKANTA